MKVKKAAKKLVPRKLWRFCGLAERWLRTIAPLTEWQKRQLLSDTSLRENERRLLAGTSSRIFYDDRMYTGDGAHYFKVGLSAIRCIEEALACAGELHPKSILDFACGGGRVLRFLAHRFADAGLTASEIGSRHIWFCARTFQAQPVLSAKNFDELSLGEFDLIWCGSLATHLKSADIISLLRFFRRHLAVNGLVVFSTHGDYVAKRITDRDFDYLLTDAQIERIAAAYPNSGYAFEDYDGEQGWGVSLTSPQWIRARVTEVGGLREVYFKPRGWDDHQDVFGLVRE